jgi:hypothetical protein
MSPLGIGYTYVPSRNADGTQVCIEAGSRVELSPGCDLWARGARFGSVKRIELDKHGREVVIVKMDHPSVKRLQRFFPAYLMHAE